MRITSRRGPARNIITLALALAATAGPLAAGCSSDSPSRRAAGVATGCVLNSDCDALLTCSAGLCHQACAETRDCDPGLRCVKSSKDGNVCQLLREAGCVRNSDCTEPLTCATDSQCRNACTTKRDCVPGQTCTKEGVCAEPSEVDSRGNLINGDASDAGGTGGAGGAGQAGSTSSGGTSSGGGGSSSGGTSGGGQDSGTGGTPDGGSGDAAVMSCGLGEPCCPLNVCEAKLACLGKVCSCVAELSGEYMVRTDGVAFHTFVNDTGQSVVVNADTGLPLHGIVSLVGNEYNGCAALDTGEARCWPLASDTIGNNSGQLGNGTVGGTYAALGASLVKVNATTNLADVAVVGTDSSRVYAAGTMCAAQKGGALYCWGSGGASLINGASTPTPFATRINTSAGGPALTGVTRVAVGTSHACALTNGKVRCWGAADGTGATSAYPSTDLAGPPGPILKLGAGYSFTCALSASSGGSVYCWGTNGGSQLGIGDAATAGASSAYPARVRVSAAAFLDNVVDVAIGYGGACALRTDHTVWCWGGAGRPYATQLKNAVPANVTDAVKVSTPYGPDAPRYLTDSGVLMLPAGKSLTPNCSPQE